MIVKACLAGALSLAQLSSAPLQIDFGKITPASHPYVAQVICERGRGTAFKIDTGQWVTVKHVSENGGCKINGVRTYVAHTDGDFAIVDIGDRSPGGIRVNCEGFKDGEWYWGLGYGHNIMQSKAVRFSIFRSYFGGEFRVLLANRFVPGQSGGPVINSAGEVVGTVNAYGIDQRISFSKELRGTVLCSQD